MRDYKRGVSPCRESPFHTVLLSRPVAFALPLASWCFGVGEDLEVLRAKFLKLYASVPDKLRGEVIAAVNEKPYSWDASYVEIKGNTPLGNEILKKLEMIGLFKE